MEAAALELRRGRQSQRAVLRRALSDERLAERVRAGDDAAFEVLYDRHHRQLLAFCRHMVGDRMEAEDVLQHVFVAAYRTLRDDERELHLKAWLYAVARNRCLSVLRGRRDAAQALDDDHPSLDGLPERVQSRADLRELVGDLQKLPEEQRAALVLAELGALSHDDIAEVLGVNAQKVKALVFQAREHLMQRRDARRVPCRQIQEQLATLRGGALRRGHLRRHVEDCPACAAFGAEVRRQRAAMAALLPVVPGATLKAGVLGSAIGGGGAGAAVLAGGAGAGLLAGATAALEGVTAKVLLGAALLGGGGAGGYAAVERIDRDRPVRPAEQAQAAGPNASRVTQVASVGRPVVAPAVRPPAPASKAPAKAVKRTTPTRKPKKKAKHIKRRRQAAAPALVAPVAVPVAAPAAPAAAPQQVAAAPTPAAKGNGKGKSKNGRDDADDGEGTSVGGGAPQGTGKGNGNGGKGKGKGKGKQQANVAAPPVAQQKDGASETAVRDDPDDTKPHQHLGGDTTRDRDADGDAGGNRAAADGDDASD